MKHLKITVSGQVRNTGFHYYVKQLAQLNNIKGFVNHPSEEGITIEAEGDEADLNRFLELSMVGPNGAIIKSTNISEQKLMHYESFSIIENVD